MKQNGGMRVADQRTGRLSINKFLNDMRYFANYEADAVIREDDNGNRYKKTIDFNWEGGPAPKEDKEAWGIPSYGIYNFLEPITKREYDEFGITWDWDPRTGKKRVFSL